MGRMRETSLQEEADTKNGFPHLAVAWGIRNFFALLR